MINLLALGGDRLVGQVIVEVDHLVDHALGTDLDDSVGHRGHAFVVMGSQRGSPQERRSNRY